MRVTILIVARIDTIVKKDHRRDIELRVGLIDTWQWKSTMTFLKLLLCFCSVRNKAYNKTNKDNNYSVRFGSKSAVHVRHCKLETMTV